MKIRKYEPQDEQAVVALWQECGLTRPWNDPRRDIARKLTVQPELFLVGTFEGPVISTAMVGFDGHRGWVYYLAVAPKYRGKSFGRMLMQEAERLLIERGCPKLNLQVQQRPVVIPSPRKAKIIVRPKRKKAKKPKKRSVWTVSGGAFE